MDYQQTLQYLYSQLPMFTRVGAAAIKADLTNTIALCERLGNPQHKFKSVHIAGTNGKGSTSHMLAAILQTAGYKTGLYTSPHLLDFRERIRIDGEMIGEQGVVDFVEKYQKDFENIKPSFFEMTVAMAFDIFARETVDVAIIEVGLGGRLDSTNIITPLLSVITNIGWDHMNLLGNTLPQIASEKAGIIKPGIPVIIGEYQPEVARVFTEKAQSEKASITFASEEWEVVSQKLKFKSQNSIIPEDLLNIEIKKSNATQNSKPTTQNLQPPTQNSQLTTQNLQPATYNLQLDLTGSYQIKNVKTVLSAVEELRNQGYRIANEHIEEALKRVRQLTGLHGRWEVINSSPLTICDTGHNPEGISEVIKNIEATPYEQLHFVIGMVNDKDISKILTMLPQNAVYYFCKPDIPRGLEAESLKQKADSIGLKGKAYASVKSALQAAQSNAAENDLVFIGGSTFVVAEVL